MGMEGWRRTKQAVWWYHLSADQGYTWAQYNLSLMYKKGCGGQGCLSKSINQAQHWYLLSAGQGNTGAMSRLEMLAQKQKQQQHSHKLPFYLSHWDLF